MRIAFSSADHQLPRLSSALAAGLADATFGGGLLTRGEHAALAGTLQTAGTETVSLERYGEIVAQLHRVSHWATGSVRHAFAEPLIRYAALDRPAAVFVDDLLRSSPLMPLAVVTRRLARDLAQLTGITRNVFGETGVSAFGLNPGLAMGPLVLLDQEMDGRVQEYRRTDIVVVPETVAELSPVAGIVTLGEGNPLSHVQLLARNFGIPNVAIGPLLLPRIKSMAGQEVFAAVASDGLVVLANSSQIGDATKRMLRGNTPATELTVPSPDLAWRQLQSWPTRPLSLRAAHSIPVSLKRAFVAGSTWATSVTS